ncbi:MAG: SMI1/KNR4 family protein [Planctomycetota bacterium]
MRYVAFAVLLVLPAAAVAGLHLLGAPLWPFLVVWIAGLGLAAVRLSPACSEARRYDAHDAELLECAREALRIMGARMREASDGVLRANVSLGWRSWGERLDVQIIDGLAVCESRSVYGLVDWGKNRQNVSSFFGALESALGATGSGAVPWGIRTMGALDAAKRRLAPASVTTTIARLRAAGLCPPRSTRGCPPGAIAHLESVWGGPLPSSYKLFLQALGGNAGGFLRGSAFTCDELDRVNVGARELAAESGLALPDHAFVFFMHQGYQFSFFLLDGEDDPPIYGFLEGDADLQPRGISFSRWLEDVACNAIRLVKEF